MSSLITDGDDNDQTLSSYRSALAACVSSIPPIPHVDPSSKAPHATSVPGVAGAFLVHNLLSPSECHSLLPLVRALVSADQRHELSRNLAAVALLGESPYGLRRRRPSQHHTACLVPQCCMSSLAARLRPFLPETPSPWSSSILRVAGSELSPFLRCYDYAVGESSAPHYDRAATDARGGHPLTTFSAYSVLLYLNEDFGGGRTTFFNVPPGEAQGRTKNGPPPDLQLLGPGAVASVHVQPLVGCALVFPHGRGSHSYPDPLHSGEEVSWGNKTIIRTDVVFDFVPARRDCQRKHKRDDRRRCLKEGKEEKENTKGRSEEGGEEDAPCEVAAHEKKT